MVLYGTTICFGMIWYSMVRKWRLLMCDLVSLVTSMVRYGLLCYWVLDGMIYDI